MMISAKEQGTMKPSSTRSIKVTYWIFTVWLSLGMLSAAIFQVIQADAEVEMMTRLGYPSYLLILLGITKIAGVIVLLIPGFPLLKEWVYAGFTFTMAGALISHLAVGDPFGEIYQSLLLLILTLISWYFRPANRRINRLPQ